VGAGDIILSANQSNVHSAKEFQELMREYQKSDVTVLYVQRGPDEKLFVPVKAKMSETAQ
jgi:S1-C subfamily serine protease